MLSTLAGIFLVVLLMAGVPVLSFLTGRQGQIREIPRPALYFSAVISQWLLAGIGVAVVFATWPNFSAAGFRGVSVPAFVRWTLLLTSVSLASLGGVLLLARRGWWPAEAELVYLLVPETRREKFWAVVLLAPTAAFCEEFLYRGYLLAQLSQWLPSGPWAWGISSAAFGLAHAYQGLHGVARAALLGAFLAYPVLLLGTIYPSMAAHFLIDAFALAWLGPKFLDRKPQPGEKLL